MSSLVRRQDMPPPGGYGPIPFHRIPAKKLFNPVYWFGIALASTLGGYYLYRQDYADKIKGEVELRSARFAVMPLLQAEEDRETMRQMRRNVEYEEKLMADVEGWVVGTYYGEPVYKTLDKDKYFQYPFSELYMHTDPKELTRFVEYLFWF